MLRKLVLLLILVGLAGCSGVPDDAAKALAEKGVLDVLKDAGDDDYDPPADGKLNSAQVEMYLKVRKRELELAQAAANDLKSRGKKLEEAKEGGGLSAAWEALKAAGSVGNLFTADIRAAQELGENTAEYLWIKGRILEVGTTALMEKQRNQLNSTLETQLERIREARDKATSDEVRQSYQAQLESIEKVLADSEHPQSDNSNEAVAYNRELLSRYQDEMTAIDTELEKYKVFSQENQ